MIVYNVIFGDKHTLNDWHLWPNERPVIQYPPLKKKQIDIEGADGSIDLSEAITGYPIFENRTGTLSFKVLDAKGMQDVRKRKDDIAAYLHGKRLQMVLEEDEQFYYVGRFEISNYEYSGYKAWSDIEIDYDLEPYKYYTLLSDDRWKWDPFSFLTGVIQQKYFYQIPVSGSTYTTYEIPAKVVGRRPAVPTFVSTIAAGDHVYAEFTNPRLGINKTFEILDGEFYDPEIIMTGVDDEVNVLKLRGNGTVSIRFRMGRL